MTTQANTLPPIDLEKVTFTPRALSRAEFDQLQYAELLSFDIDTQLLNEQKHYNAIIKYSTLTLPTAQQEQFKELEMANKLVFFAHIKKKLPPSK